MLAAAKASRLSRHLLHVPQGVAPTNFMHDSVSANGTPNDSQSNDIVFVHGAKGCDDRDVALVRPTATRTALSMPAEQWTVRS
jgi:hypothetical protein